MYSLPPELLTRIAAGPREWLRLARTCHEISARLRSTITSTFVDGDITREVTIGSRDYISSGGLIYVKTYGGRQVALIEFCGADYDELIFYAKNADTASGYALGIKSFDAIYIAIIFRLAVRLLAITATTRLTPARGAEAFTPARDIMMVLMLSRSPVGTKIVSFDGDIVGVVDAIPGGKIIKFTDGEVFGAGDEVILTNIGPISCTIRTNELLCRLPQLYGNVYAHVEILRGDG
jgi:hypothetical protein